MLNKFPKFKYNAREKWYNFVLQIEIEYLAKCFCQSNPFLEIYLFFVHLSCFVDLNGHQSNCSFTITNYLYRLYIDTSAITCYQIRYQWHNIRTESWTYCKHTNVLLIIVSRTITIWLRPTVCVIRLQLRHYSNRQMDAWFHY